MEPKIADLLANSEHPVDLCVAFALLWIAAAEGAITIEAHRVLDRELAEIPAAQGCRNALLGYVAAKEVDDFLLMCRTLRRQMPDEQKQTFLFSAIAVALANDKVTISANHILRLYNDLLGFAPELLRAMYREKTASELPEPGDPSSILWWDVQEERARQDDGSSRYRHSPGRRFSRAEAFAVLGLDREASRSEIKHAYRRLVHSYHPDRYVSLGNDAREVAQENFLRVQQAYEVLIR